MYQVGNPVRYVVPKGNIENELLVTFAYRRFKMNENIGKIVSLQWEWSSVDEAATFIQNHVTR